MIVVRKIMLLAVGRMLKTQPFLDLLPFEVTFIYLPKPNRSSRASSSTLRFCLYSFLLSDSSWSSLDIVFGFGLFPDWHPQRPAWPNTRLSPEDMVLVCTKDSLQWFDRQREMKRITSRKARWSFGLCVLSMLLYIILKPLNTPFVILLFYGNQHNNDCRSVIFIFCIQSCFDTAQMWEFSYFGTPLTYRLQLET